MSTMKTKPKPTRKRQRGIALIAVMLAVAVTLVISNEFGTSTSTDMIAAANYRDQMRAHFLARSAQNLAELVIRIQQRLDNVKQLAGQVQITDYADQLMMPFCGTSEEVIAAVGLPPSIAKGLGADVGTCGTGPIKTEDDKINVNCANVPSGGLGSAGPWSTLKAELDALFYFPSYDPIFNELDAEGWQRDRNMQVAAIVDYIDANTYHLRDIGTSESYGYEELKDKYYAKNTFIDTVGELKLVRGIDDRFWSLFGNAFTVYGGCQINLATVTDPQIIAAILYLAGAAKNPNQPTLLDPKKLFMLANLVAKARQFGETFTDPNFADFIAFVKNPGAAVQQLASQAGTFSGSAAASAITQGVPGLNPNEQIGLDLDPNALKQLAKNGPRRTYRVEAWGEIERKQKNRDGSYVFPPIRSTINGVWDTKVVPQNVRKPPVPNGAWVFLRED